LVVWSNSIPINFQKLLTESIGTHYTETYKLRIQILILKSIELLGSLKYVINIILQIRYMGCYRLARPFIAQFKYHAINDACSSEMGQSV
jgi:hypothetical protein